MCSSDLIFFLEQPEAGALREKMKQNSQKIIMCLNIKSNPVITAPTTPEKTIQFNANEQVDVQYVGVKTLNVLSEFDEDWVASQPDLIEVVRALWESPDYQQNMYNTKRLDIQSWKEPQLVAKLLLNYYKKNPNEITLLFRLLLAFCGRTISQYQVC